MVAPRIVRPPFQPPPAPPPAAMPMPRPGLPAGALPPPMPAPLLPGMGPGAMPPMGPQLMPMPQGPPPPMATMQPPQPTGDPIALLLALKGLAGDKPEERKPVYRPGYKPPKRPSYDEVRSVGRLLFDNGRQWRALIYLTLMWTRQKMTGIFPEDMQERLAGLQEEYISSALSDERNLLISLGSDLEISFRKKPRREEDKGFAQRLEDAGIWFREEERIGHARRGNRPLELDEWAQLIDYGMYVSRDTLDPDNPECPVRSTLIDPAQVYPLWSGRGLDKVYRVYTDTAAELAANYGDFAPSVLKEIEDEIGKVTDTTELTVTEYWDSWQRCVLVGERPLVPWVAHEYGEVPWTIQYGGYGEPMFTRTPGNVGVRKVDATNWTIEGTRGDDRVYKATPYLYYRLKNHEIKEAIGARLLTAMKKGVNPPIARYRSIEAAQKEMNPINAGPGGVTEFELGEEKVEPLPTMDLSSLDRMMTLVTADEQRGGPPPGMYGQLSGTSNVTGVAQNAAATAGDYLLTPAIKAWQMALSRKYEWIFTMVAGFGEEVALGNGASVLTIPVSRRAKPGGASGYPFDAEVVDRVGARIEVILTKVDESRWPAFMAAAKPGIDAGVLSRAEVRAKMTGDHDFDRFAEEWAEENALFGAQQLPEFQKLNVGLQLLGMIQENEGRPDIQMRIQRMYDLWQQATMPPPQPMGMPGQSPPGAQLPQQPGMANPPTPAGVSYPQLGQGPGLNGGQVGRPQLQGTSVGP